MQTEDKPEFLNFPPPDRCVSMQSPPPETAEMVEEGRAEGAPSRAGPIDFMPDVVGERGERIVYTPKHFKAPTIVIEGVQ